MKYLKKDGKSVLAIDTLKVKITSDEDVYTIFEKEKYLPILRVDNRLQTIFNDEVFKEVEGTELWWYDDIRFLSGSNGFVRIKGDEVICRYILMRS